MNKKTNAKLDMFLQVRSMILQYQDAWTGMEAFASAYQKFETELKELIELSAQHSNVTRGVSRAKDNLLKKVVESTVELSGIIQAYAAEIGDDQLKFLSKLNSFSFNRAGKTAKIQLIERTIELADQHLPLLASYGVTQAKIDQLSQAKDELDISLRQPRKAIIDRKTMTSSIEEHANNLNRILKERIDFLVNTMKKEHPDFYARYFASRTVLDRVNHRSTPSEIPNEPDDGQAA